MDVHRCRRGECGDGTNGSNFPDRAACNSTAALAKCSIMAVSTSILDGNCNNVAFWDVPVVGCFWNGNFGCCVVAVALMFVDGTGLCDTNTTPSLVVKVLAVDGFVMGGYTNGGCLCGCCVDAAVLVTVVSLFNEI